MCTAQPLAKYSITFTGKWSQASFPKQYPLFRPPAQWSSLLGECSPCRPVPGGPGGDPHCSGGYGRDRGPALHSVEGTSPNSLQCRRSWLSAYCVPAAVSRASGTWRGRVAWVTGRAGRLPILPARCRAVRPRAGHPARPHEGRDGAQG